MQKTLDRLPNMDIPLFECGRIYLCSDKEKWQWAHEALGAQAEMIDRLGAANTFKNTNGGQDIYLLGIFTYSPSTIAHEVAHIVFDICHKVGVEVEAGKSNETFCYLLDTIVQFAASKLEKPAVSELLPLVR